MLMWEQMYVGNVCFSQLSMFIKDAPCLFAVFYGRKCLILNFALMKANSSHRFFALSCFCSYVRCLWSLHSTTFIMESALWSCCLFRTAENHKINLLPFNFVFYNCNYNSIFVIVSIVPSKKLKNHQIIRP